MTMSDETDPYHFTTAALITGALTPSAPSATARLEGSEQDSRKESYGITGGRTRQEKSRYGGF